MEREASDVDQPASRRAHPRDPELIALHVDHEAIASAAPEDIGPNDSFLVGSGHWFVDVRTVAAERFQKRHYAGRVGPAGFRVREEPRAPRGQSEEVADGRRRGPAP